MQIRRRPAISTDRFIVDDCDVAGFENFDRDVVKWRRGQKDDEEAADSTRLGQVHRHVGSIARKQVRKQRTDSTLAIFVSFIIVFFRSFW